MLWEPHQTAFTTWQLASGKTESTTITRQRWIQHLARTDPSETALTREPGTALVPANVAGFAEGLEVD
ncbi:MAG: hypothetical protein ACFNLE_05540 [Rothia aeria]